MSAETLSAVLTERALEGAGIPVPIHFQSASDFQQRAGYTSHLQCASSDLDKIIGKYSFTGKEKALKCGLNNCNQEHWAKGYVIRTKDGRETNIGSDCGKREFGVVFEELEARYQAAEDRQAREAVVSSVLTTRSELLAELARIEPEVGTLAFQVNQIIKALAVDKPLKKAFDDALRSDGDIFVFERVSEAGQLAMSKGRGEKHATIKVRRGSIQGCSCVSSAPTITRALRFHAYLPLEGMQESAVQALSEKELQRLLVTIKQIREAISDIVAFLNAARTFCGDSNRRELLKLLEAIPRGQRNDRINRTLYKIAAASRS